MININSSEILYTYHEFYRVSLLSYILKVSSTQQSKHSIWSYLFFVLIGNVMASAQYGKLVPVKSRGFLSFAIYTLIQIHIHFHETHYMN